jgi:hypothetical protein
LPQAQPIDLPRPVAQEAQEEPCVATFSTLYDFEPPATGDEVQAASLQFVRKVSGFTKPSQANEAVFEKAGHDVAHVVRHLMAELVTAAPTKDRELEAAKACARAQKRFGTA